MKNFRIIARPTKLSGFLNIEKTRMIAVKIPPALFIKKANNFVISFLN